MNEATMFKEWVGSVKSFHGQADSDETKAMDCAKAIAKMLQERDKLLTGAKMAEKGFKANKPPLEKARKKLGDEADKLKAELTKLGKKDGSDGISGRLQNRLNAFGVAVLDCVDGEDVMPTKSLANAEKAWKELFKCTKDGSAPKSCVKALKGHKNSVEGTISELNTLCERIERASHVYLGSIPKIGDQRNSLKKPAQEMHTALRKLAEDAKHMDQCLSEVEAVVKAYRGPGPLR